jgi:hypothetical protein
MNVTPPTIPSVILKLEVAYSLWHVYIIHFPKVHRYSLGAKIDTLLCEVIQYSSSALFVPKEQKIAHIQKAIQSLDTVKVLLRVANSANIMETKQYIALTDKLVEIGKMLGGWHNQLLSQKKTP